MGKSGGMLEDIDIDAELCADAIEYPLPLEYSGQNPPEAAAVQVQERTISPGQAAKAVSAALVVTSTLFAGIQTAEAKEKPPTPVTLEAGSPKTTEPSETAAEETAPKAAPTTIEPQEPEPPAETEHHTTGELTAKNPYFIPSEETPDPDAPKPSDSAAQKRLLGEEESAKADPEPEPAATTTTAPKPQISPEQAKFFEGLAKSEKTQHDILTIMHTPREEINQQVRDMVANGLIHYQGGTIPLDDSRMADGTVRTTVAIVKVLGVPVSLGSTLRFGGTSYHDEGHAIDVGFFNSYDDAHWNEIWKFLSDNRQDFGIAELIHQPTLPGFSEIKHMEDVPDSFYAKDNPGHYNHLHFATEEGYVPPDTPSDPTAAPAPQPPAAEPQPVQKTEPEVVIPQDGLVALPVEGPADKEALKASLPFIPGPQTPEQPAAVLPQVQPMSPEEFAKANRAYLATITDRAPWALDLLDRLGAPETVDNVWALTAWANGEATGAAFNPLATTQDMPGASFYNTFGDHGQYHVKSYVNYTDGINATAATLTNGYYPDIMAALMAGNNSQAVVDNDGIYKWGTGAVALIRLGQLPPAPAPYTPPLQAQPAPAPVPEKLPEDAHDASLPIIPSVSPEDLAAQPKPGPKAEKTAPSTTTPPPTTPPSTTQPKPPEIQQLQTAGLKLPLPEDIKTGQLEQQLPKIDALKPQYEEASRQTGVPWQIVAAIDYRENGNDPNSSAFAGEPLGTINPDHGVVEGTTKQDSLIKAANHLKGMAKSVYGVDLNPTTKFTDLMKAFVAYNRGSMYKNAGQAPDTSPYVTNGLDEEHRHMSWPNTLAEPGGTRGKPNGQMGAMTIVAGLGYEFNAG